MEWIFNITLFVCVIGAVDALMCILIPAGNIAKSARLILSLILSVILISKIVGIKDMNLSSKINFEEVQAQNLYSDNILSGMVKTIEKQIENDVNEEVKNANSEAVVLADIDENYRISIIRVNVYIDSGDKYNAAKAAAKSAGIEQDKIFVMLR